MFFLPLHKMGRILAIDFGTKRTGVAVSDPNRMIATSLDTVPTHQIIKFIQDYLSRETVDIIVVGHPKHLDNTESSTTQLTNQFVNKLKKEFTTVKIDKYDERFTSKIASQSLIESGQSKKVRRDKSILDQVSATILLQDYLENLSFRKL
jgi:putative Holliday junction resolvase